MALMTLRHQSTYESLDPPDPLTSSSNASSK
ncbi:hypothetical protein HOU26_gp81 [Escherichia phage IMM-002]|uniref:Uncharacterized protein n=1 Tax=Escherichia phage IMM-002 TaxID=2041760 RepID=A0A384WWA0_9CAUD|nr:hypothetical protein HOU26_gp81 [Escherichia phage IMM-002]ATI17040.1 hypothetical protein [Escherichia phage IMM-002]